MSKALLFGVVVLGFVGGFITLGGLSALQSDTPAEINSTVKPYRFAWFAWSLEVVVLLFAAFGLLVDYAKVQAPFLSLLATAQVFVIYIINDNIYQTAKLPGSNGSATRGNVTIAGLIIVAITNGLFVFGTAFYNLTATPPPQHVQTDRKSVDV